jgi:hypothetical protein
MATLEAYLYSESVTDDTLPSLSLDDAITITEAGNTSTIRLGSPKRFSEALSTWAIEANNNLPGFYQFSYNATTRRVTITCTNAMSLTFLGNVKKVLGFSAGAYGPGVSFTAEGPPAAIVELAAFECAPADDVAKAELRAFRHARALGMGWGNLQVFDVGMVLRSADVGVIMPARGSDLTGYCLTGRVRVGPSSPAYSATAPGGYLDGYIVQTSGLQSWGDDENFFALRALVAVP